MSNYQYPQERGHVDIQYRLQSPRNKALPGYLFFLPRLFVLSRVLFSKGCSDLISNLDSPDIVSWMLSRVSITITCSAYRSSMPTLVDNTFVLNAWCLVNVLMYLVTNGNKNVIDEKKTVGGSNLIRAPWTSAGSSSEPFWSQDAGFLVFIANTYLLTTQDVSTPALPRLKHVLDLSILSVFGFRSNKFASYANNVECVWHSLDASLIMIFITAVCRWVGAFDWPVTAIIQAFQNTYILSKTCREKCAEIPPAHRTESL